MSGLQSWLELQPLWFTDQSSEASLSLASDHRNTAQWRRTWQSLVGGNFPRGNFHFTHKWVLPKPFSSWWGMHVYLCFVFVCFFFLDELKEKLQGFLSETNSQRPGFIKMVRHAKQEGLIRSRVSGWRAATAPVVALFDAHVEFNVGWWVTHQHGEVILAKRNKWALAVGSFDLCRVKEGVCSEKYFFIFKHSLATLDFYLSVCIHNEQEYITL